MTRSRRKGSRRRSKDAVEILHRRYVRNSQDRADLDEARARAHVARRIYELRAQAGLSQRELARIVGTTASVICRLENDDYEGHSVAMLQRVAAALNSRVEIRFVPIRQKAGTV